MKHLKLSALVAGTILWCAFAIYMNDLNSTSDKDYASGLVRLSVEGLVASLWLGMWLGLTWYQRQKLSITEHLTILLTVLWCNSLVIGIGLPWLAYVVGWMWPNSVTAGLQVLLVGCATFLHIQICKPSTNIKVFFLVVAFSVFCSALVAGYVHLSEFSQINYLPYQTKIFQIPG